MMPFPGLDIKPLQRLSSYPISFDKPRRFTMTQALYAIFRYVPFLGRIVSRNKCWILRLPDELPSIIFSRLSLSTQACFVLTCKFLLARFGAVLKNEEFAFPHITFDYHGRTHFSHSSRARTELLLRLQGGRFCWSGRWWRYCGGCLKLHPWYQVPFLHPEENQEEAICFYPGIVAVCPCVHLNARGKIHLIQELKMGKVADPLNWHQCHKYYPTIGTIDVTISLSLTELGELMVRTRYVVRPDQAARDGNPERIMCCPHRYFLAYGPSSHINDNCDNCQTSMHGYRGDDQASVQVMRYLGGKRYPICQTWMNQCEWRYIQVHR